MPVKIMKPGASYGNGLLSYKALSGPEKLDIGPESAYFWDLTQEYSRG
jgi:hypothetical protein